MLVLNITQKLHLRNSYTSTFKSSSSDLKLTFSRLPGVAVIQPLLPCDLHAAMKNSFAVVNSSLSEGMASAILEVCALIYLLCLCLWFLAVQPLCYVVVQYYD